MVNRIICWIKRKHCWSDWRNTDIPSAKYERHCIRCGKFQSAETQDEMIIKGGVTKEQLEVNESMKALLRYIETHHGMHGCIYISTSDWSTIKESVKGRTR